MKNEITLSSAMKTAETIIYSMINSVKSYNAVSKQETIILQEQLAFIKTQAKLKAHAELARMCITEIEKTVHHISQTNLTGDAYNMCATVLNIEYNTLTKLLENHMA